MGPLYILTYTSSLLIVQWYALVAYENSASILTVLYIAMIGCSKAALMPNRRLKFNLLL
jgi:hypothetical protein